MKYIVNVKAESFDKSNYTEANQAYVVKTSDNNVHLVNNITKGTQDSTQI